MLSIEFLPTIGTILAALNNCGVYVGFSEPAVQTVFMEEMVAIGYFNQFAMV